MPSRHGLSGACRNIAVRKSWEQSIAAVRRIPDQKTKKQYSIALEEAVPEMLENQNDHYIFELLEDAAKHKKWPSDYISYVLKDFMFCEGFKVKSGRFYIADGLKIVLRAQKVTIKIDPKQVIIEPFSKEPLGKKVCKRVYELQKLLQMLQQLEKNS